MIHKYQRRWAREQRMHCWMRFSVGACVTALIRCVISSCVLHPSVLACSVLPFNILLSSFNVSLAHHQALAGLELVLCLLSYINADETYCSSIGMHHMQQHAQLKSPVKADPKGPACAGLALAFMRAGAQGDWSGAAWATDALRSADAQALAGLLWHHIQCQS